MSRIITLVILSFVTINLHLYAQDNKEKLNLNGFIDTYHALRSKSPNDFLSSRSRLRTEFNLKKGKSYFFTSLNAIHNDILPDETKIELREAFMEYSTQDWNIKAGRQIVIWGNSDGMRITDVVSPMDMTEFLARDYDDIRIPVDAIRVRWLRTKMQAELIFIPVSSFYIVPYSDENPWSVFPKNSNIITDINMKEHPRKTIKNCEYGGRLSFFLPGIDITLSALQTWNKMPVFSKQFSQNKDTLTITSKHSRMGMLGIDFSIPVSKFVFRGEVAEYLDEAQQTIQQTNDAPLLKRNTINYLLGVDYYPGSDWTITSQFSQKTILNYNDKIEGERNTIISTLGITKKLFRSTLSLSSFSYWDISNSSSFSRISADYALSDEIHLILGYDYFSGDKGIYGRYKDNSEYWFKAKYSF